MQLSHRSQKIIPSQTLALDSQAKKLQAGGKEVINLTAGEPDFDLPLVIKQGALKAIKTGNNKYSNSVGLEPLRQTLAKVTSQKLKVKYSAEEIIVVNGAKQGLYSLFQVILNPGDEVVVLKPYWVSYLEQIKLASGKPVIVPTAENFELDVNAIKKVLTKKTRVVLLNSANNPSGKIYTKKNLLALSKLIRNKNIWLISDEVYAVLTYGYRFLSPITLMPNLKKQFVYIGSASKELALPGWRVGWLAGPKDLIKALAKLQSHLCGNVNNIAQLAVLAGFQKDIKETKQFLAELKRRRQMVSAELSRIPGLRFQKPEGAFYFFIDISQIEKDSVEFATQLLSKAGVAVVPGVFFGTEGYIRLSFANSYASLQKAMKKLKQFILNY